MPKGINTPWKDYPCPAPGAKESDWGSFGKPLPDGQGPTDGNELGGGTQYADLTGAPEKK